MDFYDIRNFKEPLTEDRMTQLINQPYSSFTTPVYNSMLEKFSAAFNTFKQQNIEVISTQENSIITDAGAKFVPLDIILKNK